VTSIEKKTLIAIVVAAVLCGLSWFCLVQSLKPVVSEVDKRGLKSVVEQLWNGTAGNQGSVPDSVQQPHAVKGETPTLPKR
jgi:hypothetical protein